MDDYQYDMCKIAHECEKNSPDRLLYTKWRIGALGLLTSLRTTLISIKENPSAALEKELESITKDIRQFVRAIAKAVTSSVGISANRVGVAKASTAITKTPVVAAAITPTSILPSDNKILSRAFRVAGFKPTEVNATANTLLNEVNLFNVGKHYRFGDNKIIVGRNETESKLLSQIKEKTDYHFKLPDCANSIVILQGPKRKDAIKRPLILPLSTQKSYAGQLK